MSVSIRAVNHLQVPFSGWVRTTVDRVPPFTSGAVGSTKWRLGRRTGLDTWALDLHLTMAAGAEVEVDLEGGVGQQWPSPFLPADPIAHFGGWISVGFAGAMVPMALVAVAVDGAAITARMRARAAPMISVEAWVRWYPDQPGIMVGEAVVTYSNGSLPDLGVNFAEDLKLAWGDALVVVLGAPKAGLLVAAGDSFADGQARGLPFTMLWSRHMTWESLPQALAAIEHTVSAVGISQLLPNGNPSYPAGFDPVAWSASKWTPAVRGLLTWDAPVIGAVPDSGVSGHQEDEVFVRGEALLPHGVGAEQVAYVAALKMLARPCHHLEADGRQADPANHPDCVFWAGRPHYSLSVSPDQLGKPTQQLDNTHGWRGPDREHWLYNTVAAASRLVDSPALQWELEQQARLFLFGETVKPGWSTSHTDASRSVGWASILAVHLWRGLEDRALAVRVRDRWLDRWRLVYKPEMSGRPEIWDVRVDDARLGPGEWWIPWQQAVGAYGLDLAGEVFMAPTARDAAWRAAWKVLTDAWVKVDGRWQSRAQMPVAGGGPSDESFNYFGMSMAVAVALRHEPFQAMPLEIMAQLKADVVEPGQSAWLAPGV